MRCPSSKTIAFTASKTTSLEGTVGDLEVWPCTASNILDSALGFVQKLPVSCNGMASFTGGAQAKRGHDRSIQILSNYQEKRQSFSKLTIIILELFCFHPPILIRPQHGSVREESESRRKTYQCKIVTIQLAHNEHQRNHWGSSDGWYSTAFKTMDTNRQICIATSCRKEIKDV